MEFQDWPASLKFYILSNRAIEYVEKKIASFNLRRSAFFYVLSASFIPGLSQDKISKFFGVDKSTAARRVDSLEKKGFIIRQQNPNNRRANEILPTSKGEELGRVVIAALKEWQELYAQENNDQDFASVFNSLNKILIPIRK